MRRQNAFCSYWECDYFNHRCRTVEGMCSRLSFRAMMLCRVLAAVVFISIERIVDWWFLKTSCAGAQLGLSLNQAELSGLSRDSCGEISGHGHDREGDASPRKHNPEGQSNFTSDEDKSIINERRQKRMISNRESARRSRLRKQQHLDELRSQIAHLQAENAHLVNRFSVASQQYVQLTEENSVLRSNATNLRHQLEMLHHGTSGHQLLSLEPHNLSSVHPLPFNLNLCSGATEDAGNWG